MYYNYKFKKYMYECILHWLIEIHFIVLNLIFCIGLNELSNIITNNERQQRTNIL